MDGKPSEFRVIGFDFGGHRYVFEVSPDQTDVVLRIDNDVVHSLPMPIWQMLAVRLLHAEQRDGPLGRYSRRGSAWSNDEDECLTIAHSAGWTISKIAEAHARTPGAIESRLVTLGLIPLPERYRRASERRNELARARAGERSEIHSSPFLASILKQDGSAQAC
jgi:hypothetical protein